MPKKITIAIDGFSSTGKSTLAKLIAKKYNYIYVDTGAMYRAITLFALDNGFVNKSLVNENELVSHLDDINLSFKFNKYLGYSEIYLNEENVENKIRSLEISQLVSNVSKVSQVRKKLVKQQQLMGEDGGIVMDGRDIGTVVFPNADLKFYLTASANTRAMRRFTELKEKGDKISYKDVLFNVQERDRIDSTRADSPLKKADDAIEIDNSRMTIQEQLEFILNLIDKKIAEN